MTALRTPLTLVWLVALWLLLWADLSAANLLSGIAIALLVMLGSGRLPVLRRRDDDAARISPLATVWFVVWVIVKLVQANLILAWEILTPRNRITTGVIAVPLRSESPIAFTIVANVITLTPGTLTLEVAGTPPVLYVHVLHLHDVEQVRRDLQRVEELSVRAFGSRRARAELAASAGRTT